MTEPLQQATAFGGTVGNQTFATNQQRSTGARQTYAYESMSTECD